MCLCSRECIASNMYVKRWMYLSSGECISVAVGVFVCPCSGWCVHAVVGVFVYRLVCLCIGWCVRVAVGVFV